LKSGQLQKWYAAVGDVERPVRTLAFAEG
jgi:hypothetical protein